ncbi:DUF6263 family protein [Reichenbachiella ulvae]|uniref:DUF6263 family protein n=1 Tax=Reichenbachiella ulvae TaxID=2980104 RepID=A0ABT3CTR4_9BACT|nr:DUF6263 family protein [Reichenbachiella ulvae]MCV9387096.1 DUF6263 family protein [Reichenbachiella ulvae]
MRKLTNLVLMMLFAISTLHAQKTDLSLKLKEGESYSQITESTVNIVQDMNGQKMNMTMIVSGSMTFKVKSISKEGFLMDAEYDSLAMTMKMPQGAMSYSSEKEGEVDLLSGVFAAMTHKPFEVLMAKTGKVKEVRNIESLWEDAIGQFEGLPEAQKEQIISQVSKSYGADALKGNLEMVTAIYPDKSVKEGESWTIETKLEAGMSANVTTEYTFAGVTSSYANIKGEATIVSVDSDEYIESNGMQVKNQMSGTMTSDIQVDLESGWIKEASVNQDLKGNTIIKENPQMPNGMTIPMTMSSEMVIRDQQVIMIK